MWDLSWLNFVRNKRRVLRRRYSNGAGLLSERHSQWHGRRAGLCNWLGARINLQRFLHPPQRLIPINDYELSAVCQAKLTLCIDQVTNEFLYSPTEAQKCARHQDSLPSSSTVLSPPSFPTRPGSSTLIDSSSEGSSVAKNCHSKQSRCMFYVGQHLATTAD